MVLDSQNVPANKLDTIERSLVKVNRFLRDKFNGSQVNFENYLKEQVDTDKNGNISVDEMKYMMSDLLKEEVFQRKVKRKDLEGFLSAFKYSKHGATDIGSIAPLVFETDTNKIALALSSRIRTNPPPASVNEELSAAKMKSHLNTNSEQHKISEESTSRRLRNLLT